MAADTTFLRNTNAGINEQLMTAQQQLALAQALRGQALQPIQAPPGQNGRISPLSVLAQALNGYTAGQKMDSATHDLAAAQAAQAQNQMGMMAQALRGGAQQSAGYDSNAPLSSVPQASTPGADTSTPPVGSGVPDPTADPSWQHQALLENFGFAPAGTASAYAKALMDRAAPTDQIKNDAWAGVTPQQRAGISTATTMTPNQSRVQVGADGKPVLAMVAPDPDKNLQYSVGPGGEVSAAGVPGVPRAAAQLTGANATATADAGIRDVTLPNGAVVPMRAGQAAAVGGAQAGVVPEWTGGVLSPQALGDLKAGAARGLPDAKAALAAYQRAQRQLGADPTIQAARTNQQNALAEKWKPLNDAVSNAQTINARLDTIKDLATRASTGQFSDRMQFVNSLLSMAGSEKATDEATAKALLDKNANQIVAQLGQGGMATDAARAIIGAAYPNSHMPKAAIAEAADNLKAANSMAVAKAAILQPHYLNNDPAGYQQAESQFNAAADPRIFQWRSMPPGEAKNAFARKLMQQDPSITSRIGTLENMGAFK